MGAGVLADSHKSLIPNPQKPSDKLAEAISYLPGETWLFCPINIPIKWGKMIYLSAEVVML